MSYYVSPRFLNKLAVHITKNYLDLQQVKVPLILGVHGRKGEGKTFQCELVFERMGVEVVHISGGELESPDAGDPARLIRLRYREAAELVRVRGNMAVLMINDLDAGAGRFDRMTQYTVNTQLVNNTLMNIADKPTNVQLPGSYDEKALPRIPIIATGNDFATLYAPLIRDGRMQKFYWEPSHDDRIGIVSGMFSEDGLSPSEIESLVNQFDDQAIDFFGAVRSQIYDEQITQFIHSVGIENIASRVVNSLKAPSFSQPNFQLSNLIEVGNTLVKEQAYVRTMGLVSEYNQAVTPTGEAVRTPRRRDSALLTPPANNPLRPYSTHHKQERLGKRDAQLAFSASSGSSSDYTSANNGSIGPAVRSLENSVGSEAVEQLRRIMAQGHRVGIEHVEQRRFSINSWQCYTTLESRSSDREAIASLSSCLFQYPEHYVRLVSIDSQTKRRMSETIVQRPS
ncbi:MAG: ribulose bisphosphate carboxylase small subunit [Cyanobacteria bacterium J06634_5]